MRTIGLIGGMSWESSKMYYEFINNQTKRLLGGHHSARSVMVSVDFADIERLTFEGKWDEIGKMMSDSAQQLEAAGADITLLCTNTIHLVSDCITKSTKVPFLHNAQATGTAVASKGLKKVGLLGTKFTMEKDFYTKTLQDDFNLEVLVPESAERKVVHDIIYNELVAGEFTKKSRKACIEIIKGLTDKGAEGIILGCTELPLLISSSDVETLLFDTTKIHAYSAVNWALQPTLAS